MLEVDAPAKKAICAAPSFGRLVPDLATIEQALVTHLSRAAEKLRKQDSAASAVTIFLLTNRYRKTAENGLSAKQYSNSRTVKLPHPSSSTSELAGYAVAALREIFALGLPIRK